LPLADRECRISGGVSRSMCKTAANLALMFPPDSQEVQTTRKEWGRGVWEGSNGLVEGGHEYLENRLWDQ